MGSQNFMTFECSLGSRIPVNKSRMCKQSNWVWHITAWKSTDRLKMHSVLLLLFVGWATGKLLAKRDIMDANCYHCVHEQITSTADLTQIAQYPHT